jgi:arginase
MTRFLIVPQWQGSPSARAMSLADGAEAIAGDLPHSAVIVVPVPLEAGEPIQTDVLRASSLLRVQEAIVEALGKVAPGEHAVLIGGDCSISVPAIAHHAEQHRHATEGEALAVVWFDAHGDLNTPDSSPSGSFAGMALRTVIGEGAEPLTRGGLSPVHATLVGARSLDDAEADYIASSGIGTHAGDDAADLAAAIVATGATRVYLHIDLDVLDPAEITGVGDAVPFGLTRVQLVDAIRAIRERLPLAGATIAGFAPASPIAAVEDLGAILRIVGALA